MRRRIEPRHRGAAAVTLALAMGLATTAPPAQAYEVVDKELKGRAFERMRADVGGFIQPRFLFVQKDREQNSPLGEVGFRVERARLELEGDLLAPEHRRFGFSIRQKYSVEITGDFVSLRDAYVDFAFGTEFQIRAGQFKAPAHRAILVSDAHNLFPSRNFIVSLEDEVELTNADVVDFVPEREVGVMFHGYWGQRVLGWQVGMFNGEGRNRTQNPNRKFMYVGRFTVSPFGSPGARYEILNHWRPEGETRWKPYFTLGYSVHYNVEGQEGTEVAYIGHNIEAFIHWRFLTMTSEFLYKITDHEDVAVADYTQLGGYVQGGFFLEGVPWAEDHLALMGRFEQGDSYRPTNRDVPLAAPWDARQSTRRYSVGLGVYAGEPLFRFVQDLRFVVSYTFREELEGQAFQNNELTAFANLSF